MKLQNELSVWLKGYVRLAVLGIGNPLRGDDAVGLRITQNLLGKLPKNVLLLECGMTPENYLGKIEDFKPSHVLMVDAAQINEEAGASRLIPVEEIAGTALSTHALPLSFLAEIIQQSVNAKVILLGIQPESIEFREGLSRKLQEASRRIADLIAESIREADLKQDPQKDLEKASR